ncbi:MAG TPA: site-specific DNA-methyltransferase [Clostridiales bacterium]|nr:site-specific DNA-methyltransferase [Clostridiales bacterium]
MIQPKIKWRRYNTPQGICINEKCENVIKKYLIPNYINQVQLIFSSPPFPLNRAKKYGNLVGEEYKNWLCDVGRSLLPLLSINGSIVIEIGNAWNPGEPTFSTLPMETLLEFKNRCGLHLCQEFIYYNPARLPGPIQWVNKERVRVKDSFTRLWWMSKTPNPYASNKDVLEEYSKQMHKLFESGKYNSGKRPSEHNISNTAFSKNNGGAIPSNVIIAANTDSNNQYLKKCKEKGIDIHPARMPMAIPEFFIKMLTREAEIVLDCFAGSNTTGACAERLNRNWISIEADKEFYIGSKYRFD